MSVNILLLLDYNFPRGQVELLLKHGARIDVEARMCWPGPHQQNCEERCKHIEGSQVGGAGAEQEQEK